MIIGVFEPFWIESGEHFDDSHFVDSLLKFYAAIRNQFSFQNELQKTPFHSIQYNETWRFNDVSFRIYWLRNQTIARCIAHTEQSAPRLFSRSHALHCAQSQHNNNNNDVDNLKLCEIKVTISITFMGIYALTFVSITHDFDANVNANPNANCTKAKKEKKRQQIHIRARIPLR